MNEGPKVKVGDITIEGNQAKQRQVGHQRDEELCSRSGFRTPSCSRTFSPRPTIQAKLEEDKERIRQAYQDIGYFRRTRSTQTVDIAARAAGTVGASR